MAEREPVASGVTIRWSGLFDMEDIYKKSKGYFDTKVMDFKEEKYIERIKPNGKQLEIKWTASRKIGGYYKKVIEVGILVLGMNKVEVEKDGRKLALEKGDIEFQFDAYLVKNINDKFGEGSFYKKAYDMLNKSRSENYKIELYDAVYGLVENVKLLMEMHA